MLSFPKACTLCQGGTTGSVNWWPVVAVPQVVPQGAAPPARRVGPQVILPAVGPQRVERWQVQLLAAQAVVEPEGGPPPMTARKAR